MQNGAQGFCWRSTCLMTLARLGDGDLHQNDCGLRELGDLNGDMIPPNLLVNHQFPYEHSHKLEFAIFRQKKYTHTLYIFIYCTKRLYSSIFPIPVPSQVPKSLCQYFPHRKRWGPLGLLRSAFNHSRVSRPRFFLQVVLRGCQTWSPWLLVMGHMGNHREIIGNS